MSNFISYNDKSSAKRGFARKFKHLDPSAADSYLDKVDGKWGFSVVDDQPVLTNVAPGELKQPLGEEAVEAAARVFSVPVEVGESQSLQAAIESGIEGGEVSEEEADKLGDNDTQRSAFANLITSQLTPTPQPDTAAKPAPAAKSIQKDREEYNGVKRPSVGTICAQVWDIASAMAKELGRTPTLSEVTKACMSTNINQFTARTQYARWRVFNGITGRLNG